VSRLCGGRLAVYDGEFAHLRGGVVVDVRRAAALRRGGEDPATVLDQPESAELYRVGPGFFTMSHCRNDTTAAAGAAAAEMFHGSYNNYLNDWIHATRLLPFAVKLALFAYRQRS